jgi:hypothetical protein
MICIMRSFWLTLGAWGGWIGCMGREKGSWGRKLLLIKRVVKGIVHLEMDCLGV